MGAVFGCAKPGAVAPHFTTGRRRMIPTIGLMIAAYICLRCIELWCFRKDRYTDAGQTVLAITSVVVLLVTGFCAFNLLLGSK
jgi:hypothetical protein